jgi:hypothetical protein
MPHLYPDDDSWVAASWHPTPTFKLHGRSLTTGRSTPREEETMSRETRVRQLRKEFDRVLAEIDRLENRPEEPTKYTSVVPPIIYVRKHYSHGSAEYYDYAFIRAGDGYWYSTGNIGPKKKTWDQILDWIEQGTEELPNIYIVTDVMILGLDEEDDSA